MTVTDLTRELARSGAGYELIPHRVTETACEEAAVVGVRPEKTAKTVVLVTERGFARAVIPASRRLDLAKARKILGGGKRTRLAREDELARSYSAFELGAVPPFGGPVGDHVLVDTRIAALDTVVLEAGSHARSLLMRAGDLVSIAGAGVADICVD